MMTLGALVAAAAVSFPVAASDPPNIVLVVIDDMGYHNLHGECARRALLSPPLSLSLTLSLSLSSSLRSSAASRE